MRPFPCGRGHRRGVERGVATADSTEAKVFHGSAIPEPKEVFVGELAERGEWIVANVATHSSWSVKAQKVPYRGQSVWILPVMRDYFPALAIKRPTALSRDDCQRLLMRFLSTLSWVERADMRVEYFTAGSVPQPAGRTQERGLSIRSEFDLKYFPEPESERALLALGLMREARALNHTGYAFLSFYRVLEVAMPRREQTDIWVRNRLVGSLKDRQANKALEQVRARGVQNIGLHLYQSNRCAVAHAAQEPIIDPDNPSDFRRLSEELPIIQALAELAIEELLGVETGHTVWEKHHYELAGFKHIFGTDTVERVSKGEQISDGRIVEFPELNIQIYGKEPYASLVRMSPKGLHQVDKTIHIALASPSGRVQFFCLLDFEQERLHFNIHSDLVLARDDGTPEYADEMVEIGRFGLDYGLNGELHFFETDTGALISRKDAFIPVNYFLDVKSSRREITRWKQLAQQRRDLNERYGKALEREFSTGYEISVKLGDTARYAW